jgi:hypothetical protein
MKRLFEQFNQYLQNEQATLDANQCTGLGQVHKRGVFKYTGISTF